MFQFRSWRTSIEDPPGQDPSIYPQAQMDPQHWNIIIAGIGGQGVNSGCVVTQASPTGMLLDMTSGVVVIQDVNIAVSAQQDIAVPASNLTQARSDLVLVNSSGVAHVLTGPPAAQSPELPTLPADEVAVAELYTLHGLTTVLNTHISDRRMPVDLAAQGGLGTWQVTSASANQIINNSAGLTDDTVLKFTMAANKKYRFRTRIFWEPATNGAGTFSNIRWLFTGPASPTLLRTDGLYGQIGSAKYPTQFTAYPTSPILGPGAPSLPFTVEMVGIVYNGANAGDFKLQWGQGTAMAFDALRYAGSYIEFEEA